MTEEKAEELADLIVEIADAVSKKNIAFDRNDELYQRKSEYDKRRELVAKLQEV